MSSEKTAQTLITHQANQAAEALTKAQDYLRQAGVALCREDYSQYEHFLHEAVSEIDTSRWYGARASGMKLLAGEKK